MNERDFSKVPARAFTCAAGSVELANGQPDNKSKTSPVRLKARSGQPIEHWFWGRIVHDLGGMRMHKNRLPIDYAHNDSEILGYLNHFDHDTGDLIASGAITPFKADDRASEVLFKMREGVPYEASIFFGGDGIKVQELAEGEKAEVNGYTLDGPAVIVREWPLRGVAICPYGADMNTESAANFAAGKEYAVTVLKKEQTEIHMSDTQPSAEAVEVAKPEEIPAEQPVAVEAQPAVEAKTEADAQVVDAEASPAVEPEAEAAPVADPVPVAQSIEEPKPEESLRAKAVEEFCIMEKEFGPEIATATFKSGGSFKDAETSFYRKLRDSNVQLAAENQELKKKLNAQGGTPAAFTDSEPKTKKLTLTELCERGTKKQ